MRYGMRLLTLLAATTGVLSLTGAPASGLTPTIPTVSATSISETLPAPLSPIQLPVSVAVTSGTGGTPIDVTVTAPGSTTVEVQLPGLATLPTAPALPTEPAVPPIATPIPIPTPATAPTLTPPAASPSPGAGSGPVAGPAPAVRVSSPSSVPHGSVQPMPASKNRVLDASVRAEVTSPVPSTFISTLPALAARVLLWAALVAAALAMQTLVSSALAQYRRRPAGIS
jgi:hypothetical protein